MKITISTDDQPSLPEQIALQFETVPKCPLLRPPGRQNRRRRHVGLHLWRRCLHKIQGQKAAFKNLAEPGALVRYTQFLS